MPYLHFSNHLGHQLPENKCQNWYPFGGYWRAAQPGLMSRAKELTVSTCNKPTVIVEEAPSILSAILISATWIHANLLKRQTP